MSYTAVASLFIVFSLVLSAFLQFYFVRKSHRFIPVATHGFIFASLFVCLLPFPLLVLDLDSGLTYVATPPAPASSGSTAESSLINALPTGSSTNAPIAVPEKPETDFFHGWWLTIFFSTQILAWIILPIAQEYDSSGAFTPGGRLKQSLKQNLKLYVILGIVVGAVFAYIVFLKEVSTFSGLVSLALALANAFGLCLLVIFLSCGLVGLPRTLWRRADPALLLRYYYYGAIDLQDEFDIVKMDLAELKSEVVAMDPRTTNEEDKAKLAQLLDIIDETTKVVPVFHSAASRNIDLPQEEITTKYLVKVSTKTRKTTRMAMRLHFQWERLQKDCVQLDSIVSGKHGEHISRNTAYYWRFVRKPLLRALAVLSVIMTVLVMWSETVLPLQGIWKANLSVVELLVKNTTTSFFGACVFLFYMASCGYWAIFQFKISSFALVSEHSDAASLCFVGTFLTRLILPLCYNFLWMADLADKGHNIVYSALFGRMDVVVFLGDKFNQFLPLGIPILCALIELKFFDKLMEQAGVDRHDPTNLKNPTVRQRIQDGRQLLSQTAGWELTASTGAHDVVSPATGTEADGTAVPVDEKKYERGERYAEWKAKRAAASVD